MKIKSLRNANIEADNSGGNSRIDENADSKNLSTGTNDTMILHCEQEYENAIDAVSIVWHFVQVTPYSHFTDPIPRYIILVS